MSYTSLHKDSLSTNGLQPPQYSTDELKTALNSLLEGSTKPSHDARHIFGYGEVDHTLSTLQIITATVLLDYQSRMQNPTAPSQESLLNEANSFASKYGPIVNLQHVIQAQYPRMALAAEFKRASPSKGAIALDLDAGEQALQYAMAGANIISVLTEKRWFQGSLEDLIQVRLKTNELRPAILRKEFIVNEYMIAEAAANGADTVLLIVAVLPQHLLERLIQFSRTLGMEPLVEVHADIELEVALQAGAKVIGINNRNLHTFQMDLSTTDHVAELMDQQSKEYRHGNPNSSFVLCSLSGMSSAADVHRYRETGVGMCLIGESLMRSNDPQQAIRDLCLDPREFVDNELSGVGGAYTKGTKIVKVCGITNPEDALVACQAGANLIGVIFAPRSKRCVTPQQAKVIVDTVRTFGERRSNLSIDSKGQKEPLTHLVSMAQTLERIAGKRPLVVGVFQNQDSDFIRCMVTDCGLDMVQLHGQEGMAACASTGVPTIRVVDVEVDSETGTASSSTVENILRSLTTDPAAILLDTSIQGQREGGGTGITFDWNIARQVQATGLPVIVAGGLNPDNVKDAIYSVQPWGVDVSSGVELGPGKKDHEKVKSFLRNAKQSAVESAKGF